MNANQANKKLEALNNEVYRQLYNESKNEYDPDITITPCNKEEIALKKEYNLSYREETATNKKRRAKRPSELAKKIINDRTTEVKEMIIEHYYASITAISQSNKWLYNEKTARKIIKCLFKLIGYENIEKIPKAMLDIVIKHANMWREHTNVLYKCCKNPEKALDYMKTEEIKLAYEMYLITKKVILIECNSEKEYHERIALLHQNKVLNAVYAAGRALK